jgi:hypothetical protein
MDRALVEGGLLMGDSFQVEPPKRLIGLRHLFVALIWVLFLGGMTLATIHDSPPLLEVLIGYVITICAAAIMTVTILTPDRLEDALCWVQEHW